MHTGRMQAGGASVGKFLVWDRWIVARCGEMRRGEARGLCGNVRKSEHGIREYRSWNL